MEKFYSSKALLKLAGGGDASPIFPPRASATDHVRKCPIISTLNQVKSKINLQMSYKTVGPINFNVHQSRTP